MKDEKKHRASGNNRNTAVLRLVVCAWLLTLGVPANAQQTKTPKIGMLQSSSAATSTSNTDAFRRGLRELGYIEGKNIQVEYRYADGKPSRLSDLALELVQLKVDVIVAAGTQSTTAAKQATRIIPIVVGAAGDLVRTRLVASLARPGGNITGSTVISPDVSGKRVELLKEVVPKASRVAVLLYSSSGTDWDEVKQTEGAAQPLKLKIQIIEVRNHNDFQSAYAAMKRENADALILSQSSFTSFHRKQLAELGIKSNLPTMCESARWTEDGCGHVLRTGPTLPISARRGLCRQDSKGRQARRPARRAADQV
jgi:putative ABC transport system substrate-binding protein